MGLKPHALEILSIQDMAEDIGIGFWIGCREWLLVSGIGFGQWEWIWPQCGVFF